MLADCDNYEKPRVCPSDCGAYQNLEAELELLKAENTFLKRRVLVLSAIVEFLR